MFHFELTSTPRDCQINTFLNSVRVKREKLLSKYKANRSQKSEEDRDTAAALVTTHFSFCTLHRTPVTQISFLTQPVPAMHESDSLGDTYGEISFFFTVSLAVTFTNTCIPRSFILANASSRRLPCSTPELTRGIGMSL